MFEYDFSVRGDELDSYGHANHAVYLNYFEQARWEMFHRAGLMEQLKKNRWFPVVVEVQVRYSREVNLFDLMVIRTEAVKEGPFMLFRQKMYFRGTNLRACSATVKVILTEDRKLVRDIPDEIMNKLV